MDPSHADIAFDLKHHDTPKSAVGFIVAALAARRVAGRAPFTVLSCDNLPSNGVVTKAVVLEFARATQRPDLAEWIDKNARFPSTMVDRITPATTPSDLDTLAQSIGYRDEAAVFHEPFKQWVIEDDFVSGRPDWDVAGAQFVRDVEAHELMKLRCLNGTHSALAYLGYLSGHETVAEAIADPALARLCTHLWRAEILPSLPQPEGEDLAAYTAALLARYQNPAIRHRTWQIAMDGSQKLPQRILATIADNLAAERSIAGLATVVAGWAHYVRGTGLDGAAIDVRDPMAGALAAAHQAADPLAALLEIREIFPKTLAENGIFQTALRTAYDHLAEKGVRGALEELL